MTHVPPDIEELMTPGEVARVFRVDSKTVGRWAASGRLESLRTLGGHRRFRRSVVEALYGVPADVPADQ